MQPILGKWRMFDIKVVSGIDDAYVIDESKRQILIRRTWHFWKMLAALVEAMNDVSRRDMAWADRVDGKPSFRCIDVVMIAGEEWKVLGCTIILADPCTLNAYEIDHDRREIRINSRFNAAFSGPAIVEAVSEIWRNKVLELLESFTDQMAGKTT